MDNHTAVKLIEILEKRASHCALSFEEEELLEVSDLCEAVQWL